MHIAFLLPLFATAQSGNSFVDVRLDTSVVRIGERARLLLEVAYPANASVIWPAIPDTLNKHIEVVAVSGVDTADGQRGLMRQVRTLELTSFDTGFWALPPFHFIVNGSPLDTRALLLEVRTVEVDTAQGLRAIKDIHVLPFSLSHLLREHVLGILGGVAVLVALVALVLFLRRKPSVTMHAAPAVVLPLKDRTLAALRTLENERVWQQGDHKGYHSRLTDVLRGYIEERYRVPALESTTDELLKELRVSALSTDHRGQLENMLRLADMVKFAKALPAPQENEQMMVGAVRFVEETAPASTPQDNA
ncbi:MAG: hypothetical protein JNN32_13885 [Flavobacteriales bacterium]|nr:hypothetical protein [Flavobacteriales bacterium]